MKPRMTRFLVPRLLLSTFIVATTLVAPSGGNAEETYDGQLFLDGFNAYQKKDFAGAAESLSRLVNRYPRSPLRDTSYLMLAKTAYRAGNVPEAASYLALLFREYPDTPRWWLDENLAKLLPARPAVPSKVQATPLKVSASASKITPVARRSPVPSSSHTSGDEDGVVGFATSYGSGYNGKKTASGRPYRTGELTAAFPRFPLGSKAKVTNLENLREVVVTVNDRCPANEVPWITLSRAAADRLGLAPHKHARVRILPLKD